MAFHQRWLVPFMLSRRRVFQSHLYTPPMHLIMESRLNQNKFANCCSNGQRRYHKGCPSLASSSTAAGKTWCTYSQLDTNEPPIGGNLWNIVVWWSISKCRSTKPPEISSPNDRPEQGQVLVCHVFKTRPAKLFGLVERKKSCNPSGENMHDMKWKKQSLHPTKNPYFLLCAWTEASPLQQ